MRVPLSIMVLPGSIEGGGAGYARVAILTRGKIAGTLLSDRWRINEKLCLEIAAKAAGKLG